MIFKKNTNTFKKFTAFFTVFILLAGLIFSQSVFALNGQGNNPLDNMGYRIESNTKIYVWLDKPIKDAITTDQFKLFKGSSSATGTPVSIYSVKSNLNNEPVNALNTTYSASSGGGGFCVQVAPDNAFTPGQTYTLIVNGSLVANNGHSFWYFNSNKDLEFNFTMPDNINPLTNWQLNCQETYTASADVEPSLSSWLTSPGQNVNVPLEKNIWISFNMPVTKIGDVTLSTDLSAHTSGAINTNNTANSGGTGTNLNIIAQAVKVDKKVDGSWVPVTYNPLTSGGTNTQKPGGIATQDTNEMGSPVMSDDNTCISIPMSASGSAISYNYACNTEYRVTLPQLTFINGKTMNGQELTFTTAPALSSTDMAKIMISAVADSSTSGSITISWPTQAAGSNLSFTQIGSTAYKSIPATVVPTGYNIYYSTDKYWDFKLLNTEGPVLPSTETTSYSFDSFDKGLDPSTTYYFRVSSVNNTNPAEQLAYITNPSALSSGWNESGMSYAASPITTVSAEVTAEVKVVKAEGSKSQADYDIAKNLVDGLADSTVKTDLTSRLAVVKTAIDTAGAEVTATAAVVKVEGSKVQADYDAAKALVDVLADGTVKTDLTSRLAAVKTAIDASVTPGIVNVTGLNLDKTNATVQVNKNITLIATVLPDNATNKNVTWSSSNPDVVTVDQTGKVTGVKEGKATITATTEDGNISKQCEVTVTIDECFIATAAYGSKYQSSVVLLRHFRDDYLLTNTLGAEFVKFYYKNSPPIANFIAHNEVLKTTVRVLLTPFVGTVYGLYHPVVGCMTLVLICMLVLVKRRYRPHRKQ